ncbi:MAG: hypothetical protein WC476_01565 [Phycisphaerae bacterium]
MMGFYYSSVHCPLQRDCFQLSTANATIEQLKATNKRLMKALEFYGDRGNWINNDWRPGMNLQVPFSAVEADQGQRARQAIEEDG